MDLEATNAGLLLELERANSKIQQLEKSQQSQQARKTQTDAHASATLKSLYKSLSPEEQFDLTSNYQSEKNHQVKLALINILKEVEGLCDMPLKTLNKVVHGKFITLKKNIKYSSPSFKAGKRIAARRMSLYHTRKRLSVQLDKHVEVMKNAAPHDMSDLISDGEDGYIVKRPTWRSEEQSRAFADLDTHAKLTKPRSRIDTPTKRDRPQ